MGTKKRKNFLSKLKKTPMRKEEMKDMLKELME